MKTRFLLSVLILLSMFSEYSAAENLLGCDIVSQLENDILSSKAAAEDLLYLGLIYGTKVTLCENENKSILYFRKSAEMGNAEAAFYLCDHFQYVLDMVSAVKWCYIAEQRGSEKASNRIDFFKKYLPQGTLADGAMACREYLYSRQYIDK